MMYRLTDNRLDSAQIEHTFDVREIEDDYWVENIDSTLIINGVEFDIDLSSDDKGIALKDIEDLIRDNIDDWEFCGRDETEPIRD
jgi:hypothetical protein